MDNFKFAVRIFVFVVAAILFEGVSFAQTARINGVVLDSSGASVGGALVSATNVENGAVRQAQTFSSGVYSLPDMAPGTYNIEIRKNGFKILQFQSVILTVDQALTLNATLEVSATTQTVTVEGSQVAPINTTDAQISNVVNEKQIQDLPLILRDPYQLVLLTPGATYTNTGSGGFSLNGSRDRNNNFLLDGTNNNDPGVPGSGLVTLNPDSTEEFRVISNNYLPEFGRNSGSIIDIVTRSGTNNLHGDVYYFGRWNALGARDFFNTAATGRQAPYVRNAFGASVGGPVKRDKVFYFFNYEGNRFATSTVGQAVVPTEAFKTGKFTYTDAQSGVTSNIDVSTPGAANNAFGLALDPQAAKVLAFYPKPNGAPVLQGISALFLFPNADLLNASNYIAKVDFNLTPKNVLSVRYIGNKGTDSNQQSLDVLPGLGGVAFTGLTQSLNGHLATTLRPTLLNNFYATAIRVGSRFNCPGANIIDSLSLAGTDAFGRGRDFQFPTTVFTTIGCVPLGDSNGQDRPFGTWDIGDNLTWTRGRHTIKFGYEFSADYTNDFDNFSSRSTPNFGVFLNTGTSPYTGLAANAVTAEGAQDATWGLFGSVFNESQSQFFNFAGTRTPGDERGFRERDMYGFLQDEFKVASNFTFSYGMRYEWTGVPWVLNDQLTSASLAALSGPPPIQFVRVTRGGPNPLYTNDVKGFEPRIGIAWDPFKTGKTSVRAGYGVFRDRNFFNITGDTRSNPPFTALFVNNAFTNFGPTPADQIANIPIPATVPAPGSSLPQLSFAFPGTITPNFHVAYVQQWNLGIQREIGHRFVVEINYLGNKGNRLIRVIDGNPPIPSRVAALRAFCSQPNAFGCVDSPTAPPNVETVQGINLYVGAELGLLPFDAVNNSAAFHSNAVASIANSNYHGLQNTISRQFSNGMSFQANYTWSHAIDDASDPFLPQQGNTVFPPNTNELKREKGNSSFDVRNRFVGNYTAELPLGAGKNHLNNGLMGRVLEGWSWSGIVILQSGFPYEIFAPGIDSDGTGATQRADFNPKATPLPLPANPAGPQTGPNAGLFSFPLFGGPGNLGRNHFYGPSNKNFDMVFSKMTSITERFKLEFRAEAYNVLNHPNFQQPDNNLGDVTFGESTLEVGRNDGTTGSRQLQFGLKLHF